MNRTGSKLFRRSLACVACFFLALSAVSGQEVDVAVRSVDGASPAVAVDYASIIRFSSSQEVAESPVAESPVTESSDTGFSDTEFSDAESPDEFVASITPVAATSGVGSRAATHPGKLNPPNRTAEALAESESLLILEFEPVMSEDEESSAVQSMKEALRSRTVRPALSLGMRSIQHIETREIPETWSLRSTEVECRSGYSMARIFTSKRRPPMRRSAPCLSSMSIRRWRQSSNAR